MTTRLIFLLGYLKTALVQTNKKHIKMLKAFWVPTKQFQGTLAV
jgi:hypothetical protein